MYNNTQEHSRNYCCREKEIIITYSECRCVCVCVCVALVTQHAKRMCHVILLSVACLSPPHFITLSHKRQDFLKKRYGTKSVGFTLFTTLI